MKALCVTGWKNSGKTTLVERLISHFSGLGMNVASIKHAHHNFDIDQEGTDSYRHRKAGAQQTLITSSKRLALMEEISCKEPTLEELIDRLAPCDLIIVEGYKSSSLPKIVCHAQTIADKPHLHEQLDNVIAISSDSCDEFLNFEGKIFNRDDINKIADYIKHFFERESQHG